MTSAPAAAQIAVIIPHYNDADRLQRCLTALTAQDLTGVEVVVADNASTQDLSPLIAAHPQVRFVTQPEKGAAAARNKGVAETSAPWLAFLDADCVPAPDWLEAVRAITTGPAQISGGRVDVFDETPAPRSGAEAFETVFAFDQAGYIRDKGFSVTANLVTPRAIFDAVGPFVVGLSEDLEWCQRAVRAGHGLVYRADLAVEHPTRSDWPALRKKWRRLTDEAYATARAGGTGRARWALRACLMPASALAHLPKVLGHGALSGPEKLRGAAALLRLRLARMVWMLGQAMGAK